MMTRPQLTVVIVGGGIGGLFAANALIAHGFDVPVHGQAPALGEAHAAFRRRLYDHDVAPEAQAAAAALS
jgi:2-polyprenyl-6-methoxyphenol hydroxylase-like FAD-dependent oxidoreductase